METKEKAKELVDKFSNVALDIDWTDEETKSKAEKFNDELGSDVEIYWHDLAKESALYAVDEILFVLNELPDTYSDNASIFYLEVKQEIEKL
jgi:hypothetical protein